ncbi:hypothetical protein L2E82_39048 [Cichorium intybus]|uniref:Uncharacterized protein n=1 Tax=Cichorium intybus TaxID=13427 RepID=A0ACB9AHH5_CICIN|nr:hypothetical protein L2E82_39048 [Cichorium intybus]
MIWAPKHTKEVEGTTEDIESDKRTINDDGVSLNKVNDDPMKGNIREHIPRIDQKSIEMPEASLTIKSSLENNDYKEVNKGDSNIFPQGWNEPGLSQRTQLHNENLNLQAEIGKSVMLGLCLVVA